MACFFGHKWKGCTCDTCGKVRDKEHEWDKCNTKCGRCGKAGTGQHTWNGCTCTVCGAKRDAEHDYVTIEGQCAEQCSICGRKREKEHRFVAAEWNCSQHCSVCGKEGPTLHVWKRGTCEKCGEVFTYSVPDKDVKDLCDAVRLGTVGKYSAECTQLLNKLSAKEPLNHFESLLAVHCVELARAAHSGDPKIAFLWSFSITANAGAAIRGALSLTETDVAAIKSGLALEEARADPATYSVAQGVADLRRVFAGDKDEAAIQAIGKKLHDAKLPLVNGVGGMHQAFHAFKDAMPMHASALSRIWDGIGDWAD